MFGTSILSLVKYMVVAALAIILSSELLSSAAGAVDAMRHGDPIPVLSALVVMLVLMRLAGSRTARGEQRERVTVLLLSIAAYCSLVYVFVVVFLGVLPFGVPTAVVAASMSVVAGRLVYDSRLLLTGMNSVLSLADSLGMRMSIVDTDRSDGRLLMNALDSGRLRVFSLPAGALRVVVDVLRDRPRLPVSVTHLERDDFLVMWGCSDDASIAGVLSVLESAGVNARVVPRLLQEAVLSLPLLESQHGLSIEDYVFTTDPATVQRLIALSPCRMTVFPSARTGAMGVIVRTESAVGLDMRRIPRHLLIAILVGRDYRALEGSGTVGQ